MSQDPFSDYEHRKADNKDLLVMIVTMLIIVTIGVLFIVFHFKPFK